MRCAGANTTISVESHLPSTLSTASASAWSMVRSYSLPNLDGSGNVPALIEVGEPLSSVVGDFLVAVHAGGRQREVQENRMRTWL